jgi:SAM-dependent methyltransferase
LAAALHLARQRWSVIVLDAGDQRSAAGREEVRRHGGEVVMGRVRRVAAAGIEGFRLELVGGHSVLARRVLVASGPADELAAPFEPLEALGLRPTTPPGGDDDFLETDTSGETVVPGLYATGNVTDPARDDPGAADHGGRVGATIGAGLARDGRSAIRPSANQADWDHRYGAEQMWSGNPNGTFVDEVSSLAPGRALDVGAGEGADALWLAERGWHVTASDISQRALNHLSAEAERRGVQLRIHRADANERGAFETCAFDLVSAMYASIPRTPDGRAVDTLVNAVAPGGTLLVVSHDLQRRRTESDTAAESRPYDPDAYVRVDDFAALLTGSPAWDIEAFGTRPRPPGAATSAAHHVKDVVLRARRRTS